MKVNNKLKVLNVVSVFFSIPFFFGDQLGYFQKKGYEVHIICSPSDKLKGYAKSQKIRFFEFSILRKFSILNDLKTAFQLYKHIKKEKYDIVVGHTPKAALISMFSAFFARTPKRIYFRHGLLYETSKGFSKLLFVNIERLTSFLSTKVVCVSPYLVEKSLSDKLTSIKKLTILNIGSCNGIDSETIFNPDTIKDEQKDILKKKLKINKGDFVIGYVGRLVKDKGITELVEAFEVLETKSSNIKLLLIGPREDRDALPQSTIDRITKNKNIIEVGHVESNLPLYYSVMQIFVLPTLREGLGTVCLEASSMKLPVLTSKNTGSRDSIVENVTGKYIKVQKNDISETLMEFILNSSLGKELGQNGRDHIVENFSQIKIWNEIENQLYKN